MKTQMRVVVAPLSVALVAGAASASITNFREWLNANPTTPNSTSNEWFATTGLGGAMMTETGDAWITSGVQFSTPLFGPRTSVGSDNGAAGPATFEGFWVHPGSGVPAVLVFAPQDDVIVGAVQVRSELIANGLSGNGVTISVQTVIDGVTSNLGTTVLGGTSSDQTDTFTLPLPATLNAGDRVNIIFGDNGSYLFDHVNANVWLTVPAPGAAAGLLGAMAMGVRRRRD